MNRLVKYGMLLAAAALMSVPAFAQINYDEDFDELDINAPDALSGAGWLVFANVFSNFPGCSSYLYGYGVFPAPNGGPGFSSLVVGSDGQAINIYSDYNNGDQANGFCIEANVFQERVFTAGDAELYRFSFDTQVPAPLGQDVSTFGYIKMLDPNNGFATDLFLTVDTNLPGPKTIYVDLDASDDGKILQWGFASLASNYEDSGRWYDNVRFQVFVPPPPGAKIGAIPTLDQWGLLLMLVLVGGFGVVSIMRRGS